MARAKRKSRSKRRRIAIIGGIATGAAATVTAVWRKIRGGSDGATPTGGGGA